MCRSCLIFFPFSSLHKHYTVSSVKEVSVFLFLATLSSAPVTGKHYCLANITVVVQALSGVQLFLTPWTVAHLASLSFTDFAQTHIHWCHPIISTSITLFSLCPQSSPISGSFLMSWLFASGGQSIGVSASASVLSMNIQGWFPLGLAGLISLQSKGLSRIFSNTTVQKHQFFSVQPSLWSNSHINTWLLEKPLLWLWFGKC